MKNLFYRSKESIVCKISSFLIKIKESKNYGRVEKSLVLHSISQKIKYLGLNPNIPLDSIFLNPQYISIGDNFSAISRVRIEAWDMYEGESFVPNIEIGNNVIMNTDIHIGCIKEIIIGNNVLFASRIYISDHSHGEINEWSLSTPVYRRKLVSKGPVIIHDNVWIGEGVCILPNVEIGENTIIGANAVVTKSFGANMVIGGNPAKIIKDLN